MYGLRLNEAVMALVGAVAGTREAGPAVADSPFHKLIAAEADQKVVSSEAEREVSPGDRNDVPPAEDVTDALHESHIPEDVEHDDYEGDVMPQALASAHATLPAEDVPAPDLPRREAPVLRNPGKIFETMWAGRTLSLPVRGAEDDQGAVVADKPILPAQSDGKALHTVAARPSEPAGVASLPIQTQRELPIEMPPASPVPTELKTRDDPARRDPVSQPVIASMPVAAATRLPARASVRDVGPPGGNAQLTPERPPAAASHMPLPISRSEGLTVPMPSLTRVLDPLAHVPYPLPEALPAQVGAQQARPERIQPLQASAAMLQEQVISLLRNPSGRAVHIQLDPVELGHVRISLNTVESGLQIQVVTERPETLDLLRKFSAELLRDLTQMGYKDLSMSFSDQRERGRPIEVAPRKPDILQLESDSSLPQPDRLPRAHSTQAGVDIRV